MSAHWRWARWKGTTDDKGVFEFRFDLPTFFVGGAPEEGRAEFGLEVEVVDGANHREAISRILSVAEQPLQIDVIPDSPSPMRLSPAPPVWRSKSTPARRRN